MLVLETSAMAAVVKGEPAEEDINRALAVALEILLPVHCALELTLAWRLPEERYDYLNGLLALPNTRTVALEPSMTDTALQAARLYGKGFGQPDKLNFGDCMSYAVAKSLDLPLLYVGNDFAHTDIESVL